MARATIEAEKRLPFPAEAITALIGDVRSYPRFLPWLKSIRVLQETSSSEEGWSGLAEAVVGWRAIEERFATKVRCAPTLGEGDVSLVRGPLKTLENGGRVTRDGNGALVRFWIAYEFKNPVLQTLVSVNRDLIAGRIMAAFEAEAKRRFATPAPAG